MKKYILHSIMLCCIILSSLPAEAKIRIAYVEGGHYVDYPLILQGTVLEMHDLGIISKSYPLSNTEITSAEIWKWLSENAHSSEVEFVQDAFYSANWDSEKLNKDVLALKERIKEKNDIDLIFAFGTAAGISVTSLINDTNIMNFSTTDPIASNISLSIEDSGSDFIHAKIEPERYIRQLTLFHDIFKFEKLGICYEFSERGKKTISYEEIKAAAQINGFTLVEGRLDTLPNDINHNTDQRIKCHKEIASQVDAVYLTFATNENEERFTEGLLPLLNYDLPTFSQAGPQNVQLGALMSVAATDFIHMGEFEADVIKQLLNGKKLREISQIYEGPSALAVNLRNALEIGWDIPFELLAAVDELYKTIKNFTKYND